MNADRIPPLQSLFDLMLIESLFTMAGGFLDAFAFILHGHVFANAQTGNIVFFAVYATVGDWPQAWDHVPPIVAFIFGVAMAKLLGVQTQKHTFRATMVCQVIELAVLVVLACGGSHVPEAWIVPVISFVAALQITSFDTLGPWSFNSAMTTGNLKNATVGLMMWLLGREPAANRGMLVISSIACISFLVGAILGGLVSRHNERFALVPCIAIVLSGVVLTWRRHRLNARLLVPA